MRRRTAGACTVKRTTTQREAYLATCTYVVILGGQYAYDPVDHEKRGFSPAEAHLWLWPVSDTEEQRKERLDAVGKRMKWTGPIAATRARP